MGAHVWKEGIFGFDVRKGDLQDVEDVVDVVEVVEAGVEVVVLDPHGRRRGCSRGRRTCRTGVAVLVEIGRAHV